MKSINEILTSNDLKGTSWILNETLNFDGVDNTSDETWSYIKLYVDIEGNASFHETYITYKYGNNIIEGTVSSESAKQILTIGSFNSLSNYIDIYFKYAHSTYPYPLSKSIYKNSNYKTDANNISYGLTPRIITFGNYNFTQSGDFIGWLKANATLKRAEEETIKDNLSLKVWTKYDIYNVVDEFNRIESVIENYNNKLNRNIQLNIKTNWTKIDIPDVKDIIRIKNNINILQESLGRSERLSTDIPNSINFNYIKANEIEQRLNEITTIIDSFDFQYYNCGNAICGSNLKIGGVL